MSGGGPQHGPQGLGLLLVLGALGILVATGLLIYVIVNNCATSC